MTRITDKLIGLRTRWFPAEIKPTRTGVYRVRKSYGEVWAHWNGRTWSHGCGKATAPASEMCARHAGAYPVNSWRGLTESGYARALVAHIDVK